MNEAIIISDQIQSKSKITLRLANDDPLSKWIVLRDLLILSSQLAQAIPGSQAETVIDGLVAACKAHPLLEVSWVAQDFVVDSFAART